MLLVNVGVRAVSAILYQPANGDSSDRVTYDRRFITGHDFEASCGSRPTGTKDLSPSGLPTGSRRSRHTAAAFADVEAHVGMQAVDLMFLVSRMHPSEEGVRPANPCRLWRLSSPATNEPRPGTAGDDWGSGRRSPGQGGRSARHQELRLGLQCSKASTVALALRRLRLSGSTCSAVASFLRPLELRLISRRNTAVTMRTLVGRPGSPRLQRAPEAYSLPASRQRNCAIEQGSLKKLTSSGIFSSSSDLS